MINKSRRMEGHSVRPIEVLVYGLLDEFVWSEKNGRAEQEISDWLKIKAEECEAILGHGLNVVDKVHFKSREVFEVCPGCGCDGYA